MTTPIATARDLLALRTASAFHILQCLGIQQFSLNEGVTKVPKPYLPPLVTGALAAAGRAFENVGSPDVANNAILFKMFDCIGEAASGKTEERISWEKVYDEFLLAAMEADAHTIRYDGKMYTARVSDLTSELKSSPHSRMTGVLKDFGLDDTVNKPASSIDFSPVQRTTISQTCLAEFAEKHREHVTSVEIMAEPATYIAIIVYQYFLPHLEAKLKSEQQGDDQKGDATAGGVNDTTSLKDYIRVLANSEIAENS